MGISLLTFQVYETKKKEKTENKVILHLWLLESVLLFNQPLWNKLYWSSLRKKCDY